MTALPPHLSPTTAHAIGELCIAGDWACIRGDLATLESIAERLAGYATEPIHCDLTRLRELCASDPTRATEAWARLKDRVYCSVT